MRRIRLVVPLLVAITAIQLLPAAAAQATPRYSMLAEINSARAAHGLRPLRLSSRLDRQAQGWAGSMIRRNVFTHASLSARGFRSVAEVLEMHGGTRPRVKGTLRNWMGSPGHRAILLTGSYRVLGLGRATGRMGGGRRATVWVGRLAR